MRSLVAFGVMVIFLFATFSHEYRSTAELASELFELSAGFSLVGCLLAGVFQTADCLSSEKRDGTLGLLFLTDLRGYDVVLGKLASNSLNTFYGLLSILPVLALPLLMGGVSVGEFWRVVLVLITSLFFSLAVGILMSAISQGAREALVRTVFVMLMLTAVLPAIYAALKSTYPFAALPDPVLLWPSAGFTFGRALDDSYGLRSKQPEFWHSLELIAAMGLVCLTIAIAILPRVWQDRVVKNSAKRGLWFAVRFGSRAARLARRRGLLSRNPFGWLATRDRLPQFGLILLVLVLLPLWLTFFHSILVTRASGDPIELVLFTTFGLSLCCKTIICADASRRLCDDRQSWALELLLVTPLDARKIVNGQLWALRQQYWLPSLAVILLFAADYWLIVVRNPMKMNDPILGVMMVGNMVVFVTDFYALSWAGMWAGLRVRQHPRAVFAVFWRILVLPWLMYFVMGFSGFFDGQKSAKIGFACWFAFGVINDLFWALQAKLRLRRDFRLAAAGLFRTRRRQPAIARLRPATA